LGFEGAVAEGLGVLRDGGFEVDDGAGEIFLFDLGEDGGVEAFGGFEFGGGGIMQRREDAKKEEQRN
jgi:hypothetical protein